jgi:hypothetical protein
VGLKWRFIREQKRGDECAFRTNNRMNKKDEQQAVFWHVMVLDERGGWDKVL